MVDVDEGIVHVERALLLDTEPVAGSGAVRQALSDERTLFGLIYSGRGLETDGGFDAVSRHGLIAEWVGHSVVVEFASGGPRREG
jgi:hypothetical protein